MKGNRATILLKRFNNDHFEDLKKTFTPRLNEFSLGVDYHVILMSAKHFSPLSCTPL